MGVWQEYLQWWETTSLKQYNTYGWQPITTNYIVDPVAYVREETFPSHVTKRHLEVVKQYNGFGVKTLAAIQEKSFVIEYVGELISYERKNLRPFQKYTIEVVSPFHYSYIDASRFGNIARYINHSCDPNCEFLLKFKDGYPVMCVYSITPITNNTFLSIDYFENDSTLDVTYLDGPCLCASEFCKYK
jgi:SET domain-containing protein